MPRANARSGGVSMVRHISAVLLLAALLPLTGCRSAPKMKPSTPAPQPASADRDDQIRRMYQEHNRDIRVGLVIATLPQYRLAAVGDIAAQDIAVNVTLSFIDGDEKVLTTGVAVHQPEA